MEAPSLVSVGTFFISTAPSLALLLLVLIPNSHLLVVSILGAFMWCVSMMLAGCIWLAVVPWRAVSAWSLFLAVTCQELLRLALYRVFLYLSRRGDGVEALLRPSTRNDIYVGLAVGTGYGLLASMVNFFAHVIDRFSVKSAVYVEGCPMNFLVTAASHSLAFNLLHIALGVLVWPTYADRNWLLQALVTYLLHLGVAMTTLLNSCVSSLAVVFVLVTAVIGYALYSSIDRIRKVVE